MLVEKISDTYHRITFSDGRQVFLVGTAHVSKDSVNEVARIIEEENPDRVCIQLDGGRMQNKSEKKNWENMDIRKVFKEGKGFLLLANTALASFQKRMGTQTGSEPGAEIIGAAKLAQEKDIPVSLCDREIHTTFKRAWATSSLWNKCKLLATLISAVFSNEEISEEELEKLKNQETLESMLNEVAKELPSVKTVLIDERDQFLASKIFDAPGDRKVAVIGAGHTAGIIKTLEKLEKKEISSDTTPLTVIPPASKWSKVVGWLIPLAIVAIIIVGFTNNGWDQGMRTFLYWVLVNSLSTLIFTFAGGGSFLTALLSAITAPYFVLNPVLGVGMFAGIMQATFKKPKVKDFEGMSEDATTFKGWYKNRILRCLLVFLTSTIGSMLGSLVAFPMIIARL